MRAVLLIIVLAFIAVPAMAMEQLTVGDSIPHTLELSDQNGAKQSFESVVGDNGAVLVFYRSADWCPYCQIQLIKLNKQAQKFTDAGYPLVGISYDPVDDLARFEKKLKKMIKAEKSGLVLLSDTNSEVIKSFGIFNTDNKEGSFGYGVPYPTIYVVNKDKTIKAILTEEGYKDRPEAQDILDALK